MNLREKAALSGVGAALLTAGCATQEAYNWAVSNPEQLGAIPLAVIATGLLLTVRGKWKRAKELEDRDRSGFMQGKQYLERELYNAETWRMRDHQYMHPSDSDTMVELLKRGVYSMSDLVRDAREGNRAAEEAIRKSGIDPNKALASGIQETPGFKEGKKRRMKGRRT